MTALGQPRFVDSKTTLTIVGLSKRYTASTLAQLGGQWLELQGRIANVTGRVDANAYGVWFDVLKGAGQFTFVAGVAVGEFAPVPPDFSRVVLARLTYAVFLHEGDPNDVRRTADQILKQWLPQSGWTLPQIPNAPDFVEVYSDEFNRTGAGPIEVWLPVEKK